MDGKSVQDNITEFIRSVSLFSIYDDEEIQNLLKTAELKSVGAGEIIFNQGDPGTHFFIVYSGRVRIYLPAGSGKEINLGVLSKGDHFGEAALITESTRNASARAAEETTLLAIDKTLFHRYFLSSAQQRDYFDKFLRYTSIHRFLKSCTDLSVIPAADLKRFVTHFNLEFLRANEAVFRQGSPPDKFYLIEEGKAKVVRWVDGKQELINFLHEGDFFGEKALIEDAPRHADVICLTDCRLLTMSREDFDSIVVGSPKLRKVVEDRIASYQTHKPPIPYQELIRQELSHLKVIRAQEEKREEAPAREEKRRRSRRAPRGRYRLQFPFIRQYDQRTCGTTCIMMIAKYHGKIFSSNRLRELSHVDLSGASLGNLASAAEQLGFSTRAMKYDYESLMKATLPCIVHWRGYHFVVVYRVNDKTVWVADPALGLRKYSRDEFSSNWNGITLVLEKTPDFSAQREDRSSIWTFYQFVSPYKLLLVEIFLASLLLNVFGLAMPIFTQVVIDQVITSGDFSMLHVMLLGVLLVLVFRFMVNVVRQYLIVHTSLKIDLRMLVTFFRHILSLPLGYFKVRKIGDFVARFGENQKIRDFFTRSAVTLALDGLFLVGYLTLMFVYNVPMTLLVLAFVPVFVGITLFLTPILKRQNEDSFNAKAEADSSLIEAINAVDTVKAANIEFPTRWKWENRFVKSLNCDYRLFTTAGYFGSVGEFIGLLSSTLILWYGAMQVMRGGLSLGQLMAFMALVANVISPINHIVMAWDDIQQVLVSIDRINDVFTAKPEFPESLGSSGGIVLKEVSGELEFDEVYFRYGGKDDPYILSNVSFKVMPGEMVAIVGRSGSGKSTLVKLIARFYDVAEGRIKLDGSDVRNIDLGSLRRNIGFVLQESFLFDATIRENIALGDSDESMERVIAAAKLANAHDFISGLALGYETRVGASGIQLSGGQKQRIAIARVLYSNPKILILDEATSSLDTESERAIQKNMRTILQGKTSLVIAHRLSTVRNADRIVVLDDGEVVEQGTHEELMGKEGLYHYLNHQQLNL